MGTVEGSGLHMLWHQALVSEDIQGQSLTGWTQVWVNPSVCLCSEHTS